MQNAKQNGRAPSGATNKKKLLPSLAALWGQSKSTTKGRSNINGNSTQEKSLPRFTDIHANFSALNAEEKTLDKTTDVFTKALDEEGLLKCSNTMNRRPVLTICHGFLDSELSMAAWSYQDEKKYKESFKHLDKDKQESYIHLFSTQYPMEPLVDGLPGTVWLECIEPTLAILKALNALKRRKSNLSIRKCFMSTVDSNSSCHGDFETPPLMMNPFVNAEPRLLRFHFLALEGVITAQLRNGQNNFPDTQDNTNNAPAVSRSYNNQRRRQLHLYRPYGILNNLIRNADQFENIFEFGEMIRNENNHENRAMEQREL